MNVRIVRHDQARSLLADPAFRARWEALLSRCPWATAFQSPAFVGTWYEAYRHRYDPVLVLSGGDSAGSELAALLPLAEHLETGKLAVAGTHHAEYHAWISAPAMGDAFPLAALQALRRQLPADGLRFKYLPPGAPTAWLATPQGAAASLLKPLTRPLMRLGDGREVADSLRKSSNKSRLKRLERIGPVEFLRISDAAQLEPMLDEIITCYDSRRMAVNGSAPFARDPFKRTFHLAMLRQPGLLHVAVLRVGGRVAAAHMGACTGRELQLGLIVHNPLLAMHSPGKFHILFLARLLVQEGFEQLDLTAGGDPYKERFANAWDSVHALTLFPTAASRSLAAVVDAAAERAKKLLAKRNITTAEVRSIGSRLARRARPAQLPLAVARAVRRWTWSRRETHVYTLEATPASAAAASTAAWRAAAVKRDALLDLHAYRPGPGEPTHRDFFAESLRRIERDQRIYTDASDGRLAAYGWMIERPTAEELAEVLPGVALPPGGPLLYGLPGCGDDAVPVLRAALGDATRIKGAAVVHVALGGHQSKLRQIVESLGGIRHSTLIEAMRFGRRHRWTEPGSKSGAVPVATVTPPLAASTGRSQPQGNAPPRGGGSVSSPLAPETPLT